jgi:hypothetical protein
MNYAELDEMYAAAGRTASRQMYKRACIAAGVPYAQDSEGGEIPNDVPDLMSTEGAKLARNTQPRNAYGGTAKESPLFKLTQPETWEGFEPGDASPFDDHMDELLDPSVVKTRNAFASDADVLELKRLLDRRFSKKPRRSRTDDRSVAMDSAIATSAQTDRAIPVFTMYKRLAPTQTIEQARQVVDKAFGADRSCDFLALEYMLKTLPGKSLVREIPDQQGLATLLARLELAA